MSIVKTVLSAEDDINDAFFLRQAFERAGHPCQLLHVSDGQEAIDYLNGTNGYSDRARNPLPHLVLLDLNMHRMGGFEVLTWLKDRKEFGHLPRIVLSSSEAQRDKERAQSLGASGYYVKPIDFSGLIRMVSELAEGWLGKGEAYLPSSKHQSGFGSTKTGLKR